MKIAIIGSGYVGLVSGVCLALGGHEVCCLDIRGEVVNSLNKGVPIIHEKGLTDALVKVLADRKFSAGLATPEALLGCQLVLLAVGTPSKDGEIDLQAVEEAARLCAAYIKDSSHFISVILKSTVTPGTTDTLIRSILEASSGKKLGDFGLGMNPEFLREGCALDDFMHPDRIVLGFEDLETRRLLLELYAPWNCEKIAVNTRTAEMIKYANNCLLATQISAVNELANLATAMGGLDIDEVMKGVHMDRRWSPILENGLRIRPGILSYLLPGCGFGGSCFPKDVQALRTLGNQQGVPMQLLQAVLDINEKQPLQVISLLEDSLGDLKDRLILILGLAFKPGTDDIRDSASIKIARALAEAGAQIIAHDPVAAKNSLQELSSPQIEIVEEWIPFLPKIAAIVVATAWPEYQKLTESNLTSALSGKIVVDARRMFQPENFPSSTYLCIGRRT